MKEDEPRVELLHPKEGADVSLIPPPPPVKERESPGASSVEQGNQNRKDIVEGSAVQESKATDAAQHFYTEELSNLKEEDEGAAIQTSESEALVDKSQEKPAAVGNKNEESQKSSRDVTLKETPGNHIQEVDQKQDAVKSSPHPRAELEAASGTFSEHESGMKTYFETSSKSHKDDLSRNQSYYELSTVGETTLHEETENMMQKPDEQHERKATTSPIKMSLEQRSLPLNVNEENPKALPERLCAVSGTFVGFDINPSTPSVDTQHHLPPAVSITPTAAETSKDTPTTVGTPLPCDKHNPRCEQPDSFPEMLDLAGALPRPSLDKRELDHMRRKSMPNNVSALMGSSLDSLALRDGASRSEGDYCVFSEYLGPMPSPADVPSPGDSPHQRFPSTESDVEQDLGTAEAEGDQKVIQPQDHKAIIPESPPKTVLEKKDVPVKSTLILEKAVTSGVKPDRLRIPMNSSKDRLTEFRLEAGLPGDLKIQAIPEVDIEKDPSREASPIPPDNSFTFTLMEAGSKAPPTPTTPKSPNGTPSDILTEKASEDLLPEVKADNDQEVERANNKNKELDKEIQKSDRGCDGPQMASSQSSGSTEEDDKKIQSEHATPPRFRGTENQETLKAFEDSSTKRSMGEKKAQIHLQEVTPDKYSPKPHISSAVIIIPQAQVDDEDDIEIAEEPQEMMEEAEESQRKEVVKEEQKMEQVRLMVGEQMMDEDSKSGAEDWSHSAANSDEGEPATDSSHLSPYSDHDQPGEGAGDEGAGEENLAEVTQINRNNGKKEQGEAVKEVEEVIPEADGEDRKQKTMDKEEEKDKGVELGQEVEETSDVLCQTSQAANSETTMDVSFVETDSGWMDSQGTQSLITA